MVKQQINSIAFLKDLKGKMVKSIIINLNEKQLQLASIIREQLGQEGDMKCELFFRIHDLASNRYVDMRSSHRIPLSVKFLEQLDEMGVKYSVINE